MDTYIVLLRGINVGGRNKLPMADLRALVAGLGFGDVRTHLQSGNVVCTGTGAASLVAGRVSSAIADQLGLSVPVVARSGGQWAALIAANPFAHGAGDTAGLHVTVLAAAPDPGRVAALESRAPEFHPDRFVVEGPDVFLRLAGGYSDTKLQNGVLEKRLGQVATTRNWRTVTALAALAGPR